MTRTTNDEASDQQKSSMATTADRPLPGVARLMGYGGLIPFVVLSLSAVFGQELSAFGIERPAQSLLAYAAIIISFIGAIQWGVALAAGDTISDQRKKWMYAYSVLPALVAFVVLLLPTKIALFGMALTVIALYAIDRIMLFKHVSPAFQVLRLHLTCVVSTMLLVAALFTAGY